MWIKFHKPERSFLFVLFYSRTDGVSTYWIIVEIGELMSCDSTKSDYVHVILNFPNFGRFAFYPIFLHQ